MASVCSTLFFSSPAPFFCFWSGVEPSPLGTSATAEPTVPAPDYDDDDDDDECGAIGGMSDRGNRSTGRKPAPLQLCPPQIPHDPTRARTQATNCLTRPTPSHYTGSRSLLTRKQFGT
jgi:hypothetical protein